MTVQEIIDKWRAVGTSTRPIDVSPAAAAIRELVRLLGRGIAVRSVLTETLPSPAGTIFHYGWQGGRSMLFQGGGRAIWVDGARRAPIPPHLPSLSSPLIDMDGHYPGLAAFSRMMERLKDATRLRPINTGYTFHGGSFEAHHLARHEISGHAREAGMNPDVLAASIALTLTCGWWRILLDDGKLLITFIQRPTELAFDRQGLLHKEGGPAILYGDGNGDYYWHGELTTRTAVMLEVEEINVSRIVRERNVHTRRILIERMGAQRFMDECRSTLIDHDEEQGVELFHLDIPAISWNDRWPANGFQVTRSTCPSTGKQYVEFLGQNRFNTVAQALAWQWPQVEKYKPDRRT